MRKTFEEAKKLFKKLCDEIGGRVVEDAKLLSCIKDTENIGSITDYLEGFHVFASLWKNVLEKPIELSFENKLLGGWKEIVSVTFDPRNDEYTIYAHVYSEYGVEPQYVEDVKDEVITKEEKLWKKMWSPVIKGEGFVSQNPATDEFVGEAEAWTTIRRISAFGEGIVEGLVEAVNKVLEFAGELSEEAKEELIIPVE